ncbi:MAG: hypothetical protein KAR38_09360, partial [Calditrichia bacterium]|nr:hypothetical protein [Calditrichia bacterium]
MSSKFTFKNIFLGVHLFLSVLLISCEKNTTGIEVLQTYKWEFSSPEEQGMDSQVLNEAFTEADDRGFIDCILIVKNGYIISEEYFNGYGINKAHNVRSVSKSFLSAITGIALRDSILDSLDQKVLDFFP